MKRLIVLAALGLQAALPRLEPRPDVHLVTGVLAARALERPIAGISVAVGRQSPVPFVARAFGLADVARKNPVTVNTVFHVASVSKYIAAAVVLRLVEERKLALDQDITKYVPEAPTQGRRVTIRQLLTHTSGLYNFTDLPDAAANEQRDLTEAQVLALIKDRPFDFEPGTSWRYSNTGFYLVGMAIERVTGQSYATYLRDTVFVPLRMMSSSLCTSHDAVADLASGHEVRGGALVAAPPMTWTLPFAAGGICTTARDLLVFEYALDTGRIFAGTRAEIMRTPTVLPDGTRIDYGLGTRIGHLQGRRVVGHTGSGGGFNAALMTFPDDRLTVVALTNTASNGAVPLAAGIARSAFEIAAPALLDSPVPQEELAAIAGTFDSGGGTIETYGCGDKLCSRAPGTTAGQPLRRQGPFSYAVDADTEVRFQSTARPSDWVFVYSGGLFADAKRRTGIKPASSPR